MTVSQTYYFTFVSSPTVQIANNVITSGAQNSVAVAGIGNGGWAAAWNDGIAPGDVRARTFDTATVPHASEFPLNTTTANAQIDPAGARLNDGSAVFVFTDKSVDSTGDIRARLISANGAPAGTDFAIVSGSTTADRSPDVAALTDGNYVVVWTRVFSGGDNDIRAQIMNGSGAVGSPIAVQTASHLSTDFASVAGLAGGGFVIVWQEGPLASGNQQVRFQRYSASGTAVDVNSVLIDSAGTTLTDIQVIGLKDGGFAVAYTNNGWAAGGADTDVTLKIYNSDGSPRAGPIKVNQLYTAGDQNNPTLTQLDNGFIVVGWSNASDGWMKVYDWSGVAVTSGETRFDGSAIEPELIALNSGVFVSAWSSSAADGGGDSSIHYGVLELVRDQLGDSANNTIYGDSLHDVMNGAGGDDFLVGGGGNDRMTGGTGIDTVLFGGTASDYHITYDATLKQFTITDRLGAASSAYDDGSDLVDSVEKFGFLANNETIASSAFDGSVNDFNGDNLSDLVWRNDAGATVVWYMNGGTNFGSDSWGSVPANWRVEGTGDFNADGFSDLLWRNDSTGVTQIWNMQAGTIINARSLGVVPANWHVRTIVDFNGDGTTDLLWQNDAGTTQIWNMNSDDTIESTRGLGVIPAVWKFQDTGDFNGDGRPDMIWRHDNGTVQIWNMNDGAIIGTQSLGVMPAAWKLVGTGDFNGDHNTDLVWRNDSGLTQIWDMNGAGNILHANSLGLVPNSWKLEDTGDYNFDGKTDLLWRNDNGATTIWTMNDATITNSYSLGVIPANWHIVA
ncbi:VCBS repeat-containing protein [Bradyrhizobium lablabi]|uniref:FG-GAP-like repeat-containing protein n=1 Tax=Bradyrhizobium lablabi TaxID=722472 RepID=UPI001BA4ADFA|nr:VCBS repeat-containing protein [Bradyrhizobium lablabi]